MKETFEKYIIGTDIGTGSTKAIAMDAKGNIIAHSQIYYSTNELHPGYSEQDPQIIWQAFVDCIKKIISDVKFPPVSISLSSAMHGLLVMGKNDQSITPLITWADTRSEKIAERIRRLPEAEELYKATGTPIHSMTPLCKIIWLKENEPEIYETAFKFISIKEYIWFRLFSVYEADYSIASATGLFNIQTFKWNEFSLKLCSINSSQLAELVATDFIRKDLSREIAASLNIPVNTTFCIGASDGCLANIGSYAIEKGTAALTIGTSGAVRIASEKPIFNFEEMSFNYVLNKQTFICGGPVNNGGNIMDWLFATFLKNPDPKDRNFENFFKIIDTIPAGSKGLLFLPYLYGERAPVWDERSCGVFFGIKPFHTNEYFLRAALEGICYSMNQVLEMVEASRKIIQLNVGGGFIRSQTWMKILADVTGKKLCVIEREDSSAVGAAILNMKALKWIEDYDSLQPKNNMLIEPDMINHSLHKKYSLVFKSLYAALKKPMHEVYEIYNQ
jgi:gluconokinase